MRTLDKTRPVGKVCGKPPYPGGIFEQDGLYFTSQGDLAPGQKVQDAPVPKTTPAQETVQEPEPPKVTVIGKSHEPKPVEGLEVEKTRRDVIDQDKRAFDLKQEGKSAGEIGKIMGDIHPSTVNAMIRRYERNQAN